MNMKGYIGEKFLQLILKLWTCQWWMVV